MRTGRADGSRVGKSWSRDCMIGSNSASLIADAYNKGIRGYDIETLYKAIIKNTKGPGPVSSVGRLGADYYNNLDMCLIMLVLMRMLPAPLSMPMQIFVSGRLRRRQVNQR